MFDEGGSAPQISPNFNKGAEPSWATLPRHPWMQLNKWIKDLRLPTWFFVCADASVAIGIAPSIIWWSFLDTWIGPTEKLSFRRDRVLVTRYKSLVAVVAFKTINMVEELIGYHDQRTSVNDILATIASHGVFSRIVKLVIVRITALGYFGLKQW